MPPLSPNQAEQLETQQPPVQPVTYEKFLAWADEDTHSEWQSVALAPDGRFKSAVLTGFWLNVDWFWQRPLPELSELFKS